jgi:tRNA uridine 5-carboxymethylaminomethyl modification enzyme
VGSSAANALGQFLRDAGLRTIRLKTGTTPRLDARTVDFSRLAVQEDTEGHFSFTPPVSRLPRVRCYLAETHAGTHDIIRGALDQSPMFSGQITGVGPRYCPSIEDKIVRFAGRKRHLLFLEPEGLDTHRLYVNGMSTSLPRAVQLAMVRSVVGLEAADILQYGYAVEYDAADPRDLDRGLQHRAIPGLYLAGQINGTSGYEEAAAQGLLAGVSACLGEPFVLRRDQAYMGVLVDDLVTRGVGGEPYRMFTSRAEHRLRLREDNADRRLMPLAREMGLLGEAAWRAFGERKDGIEIGEKALSTKITPDRETCSRVGSAGLGPLRKACEARDLVKRPGVRYADVALALGLPELSPVVAEQVETDAKYAGYLAREEQRAALTRRMAGVSLATLDFQAVAGLSNEVRYRLEAGRPEDLASAARLPGMTPAAVTTLALHVAREMGG